MPKYKYDLSLFCLSWLGDTNEACSKDIRLHVPQSGIGLLRMVFRIDASEQNNKSFFIQHVG